MAANRVNYLIVYKNDSQVYGATTREVALDSPPPAGVSLEDKRVMFITYDPDAETLSVHPLSVEEVYEAAISVDKKPTQKKGKKNQNA